jgi:hypothetical protein
MVVIHSGLEVLEKGRWSQAVQNREVGTVAADRDLGVDGAPRSLGGLAHLAWMQWMSVLALNRQASRHNSVSMLRTLAMQQREREKRWRRLVTVYTPKQLLCRFLLLPLTSKLLRWSSSYSPVTRSPGAR